MINTCKTGLQLDKISNPVRSALETIRCPKHFRLLCVRIKPKKPSDRTSSIIDGILADIQNGTANTFIGKHSDRWAINWLLFAVDHTITKSDIEQHLLLNTMSLEISDLDTIQIIGVQDMTSAVPRLCNVYKRGKPSITVRCRITSFAILQPIKQWIS